MTRQGTPEHFSGLERIDHIVVVMLENRSFDHMLGYLSLGGTGTDVDGLRPGMGNEHGGRRHEVHHLATTALEFDRHTTRHRSTSR